MKLTILYIRVILSNTLVYIISLILRYPSIVSNRMRNDTTETDIIIPISIFLYKNIYCERHRRECTEQTYTRVINTRIMHLKKLLII